MADLSLPNYGLIFGWLGFAFNFLCFKISLPSFIFHLFI